MRRRPSPPDTQTAEQQAAQRRLLEQARAELAEHRPEPGVPSNPTPKVTTR